MSDARGYLETWVGAHDELELDGNALLYDGDPLTYFRDESDRISLGPDDGGVKGEIVGFSEHSDALIVDGSQVCYVGEGEEQYYEDANKLHDGCVEWTGRFAVWPMGPRQVEVDGPLPEES